MFFHVSSQQLPTGEILRPGRWGELVRRYMYLSPPADEMMMKTIMCEIALETARKAVAPEQVSRLSCVFVCETASDATAFRDGYRPGGTVYRVEPLGDQVADYYRGDFSLISSSRPISPYIDYMSEEAVRYWTVPGAARTELLYPEPLRVMGTI